MGRGLVWTVYHQIFVRKQPVTVFLAFLTNQGNILLGIYFGLNVYLIAKAQHDKSVAENSPTPLIARITWAIGALFPALSILISLLFWVLVFPTMRNAPDVVSVVNHSANVLIALEELFWSRRTLSPVQVYVFVLYGAYYAAFTYVYFQLGGTNGQGDPYLYKVINWTNPSSTLAIFGAILVVGVPLLYGICLGFSALREHLSSKYGRSQSQIKYKPINEDIELSNKD